MDELIKKINEFAAIAKTRELTNEEKEERQVLRREYLKIFKSGLEQQIKSIKVVDENGNDITPKKK